MQIEETEENLRIDVAQLELIIEYNDFLHSN